MAMINDHAHYQYCTVLRSTSTVLVLVPVVLAPK
jgi:hypothetical protein